MRDPKHVTGAERGQITQVEQQRIRTVECLNEQGGSPNRPFTSRGCNVGRMPFRMADIYSRSVADFTRPFWRGPTPTILQNYSRSILNQLDSPAQTRLKAACAAAACARLPSARWEEAIP